MRLPLLLLSALPALVFACSNGDGTSEPDGGAGTGGSGASTGGGFSIPVGGSSGAGMGGATNPPAMIVRTLPEGFTASEGAENGSDAETLRGGYELIGPLADAAEPSAGSCANVLRVLVRDFVSFDHPDFGGGKEPDDEGIVNDTLTERKPTRSDNTMFDMAVFQFEDWYRNVEGTNVPYLMDLWLEPEGDSGRFVFDSTRFFPLDDVETDEPKHEDDDDRERNFGFTTELHTKFAYRGGETFTFRGDDDVFVFVDGQLVVDLGGVHGPKEGSVDLDDLDLEIGEVYDLDLFQAERNPSGSNFRIDTTLDFTDCGEILDDDIIVK